MKEKLPDFLEGVIKQYPDVWKAYQDFGEACSDAGPLDQKTVRLVKLALAVGAKSEGAVHSHTRRALKQGISPEELQQVALLAATSIGWSPSMAALSWIRDVVDRS
ncbi:MAG: carboxymuconolactone decarboxylase family protein [Candidatus Poribacteria bacterium]|nr:carboxymuconolactone decarboxylase family protein [Candidatus Poribacteria bacterium]MDE0505044.1 carboxymuconolactone decarboxylase family protein [Candidatus Poribacteria bacterium]